MLPTRRGSNPQPPDHNSDTHPTEPPRQAGIVHVGERCSPSLTIYGSQGGVFIGQTMTIMVMIDDDEEDDDWLIDGDDDDDDWLINWLIDWLNDWMIDWWMMMMTIMNVNRLDPWFKQYFTRTTSYREIQNKTHHIWHIYKRDPEESQRTYLNLYPKIWIYRPTWCTANTFTVEFHYLDSTW